MYNVYLRKILLSPGIEHMEYFIWLSKRCLSGINMMNIVEVFQSSRLVRICKCLLGESHFQVKEGGFGALIIGILMNTLRVQYSVNFFYKLQHSSVTNI